MITKEEKKNLLEKHHSFQYLSYSQLILLCIWEIFNNKRLELFFIGLKKGKSTYYAFNDAKTTKRKELSGKLIYPS
jgi:hypothetical protein